MLRDGWDMSQGRRTRLDGTLTGPRGDDLSTKNNRKSKRLKIYKIIRILKKKKGKDSAGERKRGRNSDLGCGEGGGSLCPGPRRGAVWGTPLEGCLPRAAGEGVGEGGEVLSGGRGTKEHRDG